MSRHPFTGGAATIAMRSRKMPVANRILNISTPLGEDATVLMEMVSNEALGQMPSYRLVLASKQGKINASELLGKNITVGLEMHDGQALRYFNGYVTQFAEAGSSPASWFEDGDDGDAYKYVLVMQPWLWFLTRSSNCRVFQNKSVLDIIKTVCHAYPFCLAQLRRAACQLCGQGIRLPISRERLQFPRTPDGARRHLFQLRA
jgi:uncharacterized protein involved in type VI secretion and phage assembly